MQKNGLKFREIKKFFQKLQPNRIGAYSTEKGQNKDDFQTESHKL
jgi:hypothetical protein